MKKTVERGRMGARRLSRIALQSRRSTWTLPIRGPHADVVEVCAPKLEKKNSQIRLYITNTQSKREREKKDLFVDRSNNAVRVAVPKRHANAERETEIAKRDFGFPN